MATSADVPNKYDVVINGQGYMLDTSYDDSPYRKPPADYSFTQTFLERTNVSDTYGDNQQDFFLTMSQNDWSLGEQRRYFRSKDADGIRRYWYGTNLDVTSIPGQATITRQTGSLTFAAAALACCDAPTGVFVTTSTNLYLVDSTGTITDKGAHGLGGAPAKWGIVCDGPNVYVSSSSQSKVRKYNGSTWSDFSSTPVDSLAYLNNVIYGYSETTGILYSYSSAGVATNIFPWKDGSGAALTGATYGMRLRPYGGDLIMLRLQGARSAGEIWQYDGTNVFELGSFPADFVAQDLEIDSGIAMVSGYIDRNVDVVPAIFYYLSGQIYQLWASNVNGYTTKTWPAMAAFGDGIVFTDDSTGRLMEYNVAIGGVHAVGSYTPTNATPLMAATRNVLVHTRNATAGYYYPTTSLNTTATLQTSLVDFDNGLTKLPRSVKVVFDANSGGTVDISYQYEVLSGSWTSLQVGATSGTEYVLPQTNATAIALQITLNKGSSASGPTLKRVYLRGAPILQSYRNNQYLLDLSGNKRGSPPSYVVLANGDTHTKDGEEMKTDLITALKAGPISITDRTGTFTGIIEPGGTDFREMRSDYGRAEYRGEIAVREI